MRKIPDEKTQALRSETAAAKWSAATGKCHAAAPWLALAYKAFLHNTQFIMIGPTPAAITIAGGKNFNLRAGDKVGLTIGLSLRSDASRQRFTVYLRNPVMKIAREIFGAGEGRRTN